MPRSYNGSTSRLRTSLGACHITGTSSSMGQWAPSSGRNAQWRNLICLVTSGGAAAALTLEIGSDNFLYFGVNGSTARKDGGATDPGTTSADGVVVLGHSYTSGGIARLHR